MSLVTIFPMSGPNELDTATFNYPKPLIEVAGTTMLDQAISHFVGLSDRFHFAVNHHDILQHHIDLVISNSVGCTPVEVTSIKSQTSGALSTALLVSTAYEQHTELIISNYDHALGFSVKAAIDYFRREGADFGCITFQSSHPKWSFVELDGAGKVLRSAEKVPISKNALVGVYYFKDVEDFRLASKDVIYNSPRSKQNFYVSEVLNQLVLRGKVGVNFRVSNAENVKFYDTSVIMNYSAASSSSRQNIYRFIDILNGEATNDSHNVVDDFCQVATERQMVTVSRGELHFTLSELFGGSRNWVAMDIMVEGSKGVALLFKKESTESICMHGALVFMFSDFGLIKSVKAFMVNSNG